MSATTPRKNPPKRRAPRGRPLADRLGIGVQVSAATPGVNPIGFVAVIEAIDGAGERHVVTVTSGGLAPARAAALVELIEL